MIQFQEFSGEKKKKIIFNDIKVSACASSSLIWTIEKFFSIHTAPPCGKYLYRKNEICCMCNIDLIRFILYLNWTSHQYENQVEISKRNDSFHKIMLLLSMKNNNKRTNKMLAYVECFLLNVSYWWLSIILAAAAT